MATLGIGHLDSSSVVFSPTRSLGHLDESPLVFNSRSLGHLDTSPLVMKPQKSLGHLDTSPLVFVAQRNIGHLDTEAVAVGTLIHGELTGGSPPIKGEVVGASIEGETIF